MTIRQINPESSVQSIPSISPQTSAVVSLTSPAGYLSSLPTLLSFNPRVFIILFLSHPLSPMIFLLSFSPSLSSLAPSATMNAASEISGEQRKEKVASWVESLKEPLDQELQALQEEEGFYSLLSLSIHDLFTTHKPFFIFSDLADDSFGSLDVLTVTPGVQVTGKSHLSKYVLVTTIQKIVRGFLASRRVAAMKKSRQATRSHSLLADAVTGEQSIMLSPLLLFIDLSS